MDAKHMLLSVTFALSLIDLKTDAQCSVDQQTECERAVSDKDGGHDGTDNQQAVQWSGPAGECISKVYLSFTHVCNVKQYGPHIDFCCCKHPTDVSDIMCCRYHQDWSVFRCTENTDKLNNTLLSYALNLEVVLPSVLVPVLVLLACLLCCFRRCLCATCEGEEEGETEPGVGRAGGGLCSRLCYSACGYELTDVSDSKVTVTPARQPTSCQFPPDITYMATTAVRSLTITSGASSQPPIYCHCAGSVGNYLRSGTTNHETAQNNFQSFPEPHFVAGSYCRGGSLEPSAPLANDQPCGSCGCSSHPREAPYRDDDDDELHAAEQPLAADCQLVVNTTPVYGCHSCVRTSTGSRSSGSHHVAHPYCGNQSFQRCPGGACAIHCALLTGPCAAQQARSDNSYIRSMAPPRYDECVHSTNADESLQTASSVLTVAVPSECSGQDTLAEETDGRGENKG